MGFRAVGNLPLPVPDGPLVLDLDHTQEALDRYRLAGPEAAAAQPSLTENLRDSVDHLLRGLGLPGMDGQSSGRDSTFAIVPFASMASLGSWTKQ